MSRWSLSDRDRTGRGPILVTIALLASHRRGLIGSRAKAPPAKRSKKGHGDENGCSVALLSCVADMSNTFRLIICVVVSSNENAL